MAETFGQRLLRLREHRHLHQATFAVDVGVQQSFISMLERGERYGDRIQAGILHRMALRLGVSMEYLLTGIPRGRATRGQELAGVNGAE